MSFPSKIQSTYEVVAAYKIEPLDKTEYATLQWLSDRGYDGKILELTSGEETDSGGYKFESIPEHVAWEIRDYIEDDPDAWLASNGSRSLSEKLHKFLDAIV